LFFSKRHSCCIILNEDIKNTTQCADRITIIFEIKKNKIHAQEKWLQTFLKAITVFQRRVSGEEKATNDFINTLGLAKRLQKKQTFKSLLNYAVFSHNLKKTCLPVELVAKIIIF